jgi:two-component system, LytTR family, sensor histidine kinase AgrC
MIGIYLLTIATEMIRFILIFRGLLGFTYRKGVLKYVIILSTSVAFSLLCLIPGLNTILLSCIIIVINLINTLVLFDEVYKIILKTFIGISVITVTWDNLIIQIINLFHDFDETAASEILPQQSICNSILIIALIVVWMAVRKYGLLHKLHYRQFSNTVFYLFLSIAVLSSFTNTAAFLVYEEGITMKQGITYGAMTALSILFQIVCITLIFLFYSREQDKNINKLREEYNEKQIEYYKALLNQEEDTRKFRHDIRNHIICIEELLDNGKLEDVKDYIKDIHLSLDKIASIYDTGSDIINAIINYYATKGREVNIKIQVKGRILQELNIPMMHLSTVVSNLISNAYEAAVKVPSGTDRIIQVELRSGSRYLEIIVKNPTIRDRAKLDKVLITTKRDKKNHGFGILNIKEVLTHYDGELQLKDDLDSVTIRVIMKMPEAHLTQL